MRDSILAPGARIEPPVSPRGEPVPVTLLTGFLGAGKTTLLNRILNGEHGLKVGVLVNDFGAVNIDAELVESVEENTIALTNGCVCCEVRDDLIDSLTRLLAQRQEIDYVVVEASGIADPEGVVMTLSDARYEELLRIDSVTCVVDAEGLFSQGADSDLAMLKLRQIGFSDLVVLNKIDLVGPEHVTLIRDWIGRHINRVRIVEAEYCDVPYEILLSVGRFESASIGSDLFDTPETNGHRFETWHYQSDKQMSLRDLRATIRKLPESVYRCKGIVWAAEDPTTRTILQAVGRRSSVSALGTWQDRTPATDLVVIGVEGGLEIDALARSFDACIV